MSNDPIVKEELEYRKNNLYDWIQNKVISKCTDVSHIEPCNELITFFEKKGGNPDLVKSLRAALEMKHEQLKNKTIDTGVIDLEDRVMQMYVAGSSTVKAISKALNISIYKVNRIITERL